MSNPPETANLFTTAVISFHDALSQEERQTLRKFETKEAMLQDVTSMCRKHISSSRLHRCCSKIAKFANAFAPYFDVINIFVQVKPEYMGLVWGPIRLIFQLGVNHVTFLEKVSDLFELLSLSLPQYERHYNACTRRSFDQESQTRLVRLMTLVYEDVVAFCSEIYLIFCRGAKENKLKYHLQLLRNSIWRPFDSQFSRLQDRMRTHQDLFDREMRLYDQETLTQQLDEFQRYLRETEKLGYQSLDPAKPGKSQDLEKERRERSRDFEKEGAEQRRIADGRLRNIQRWIWNLDHKSVFENALRNRHPGSCGWLLEKPQYVKWRDMSFNTNPDLITSGPDQVWHESILSLQAKPGFGKTTLSTAIIEDLSSHPFVSEGKQRPVLAFFHFSGSTRTGGKTSAEAFRALTAQLITIHRVDDFIKDALFVMFDRYGKDQQQASFNEVLGMLRLLVQHWPTFLLIDGVDECSDSGQFLKDLWEILTGLDCRVLLLSRPNLGFPRHYRFKNTELWQIHLSAGDNAAYIRLFLRQHLNEMADESLFGSKTVDDNLVDDLTQRSNGMFLWASLLLKYLECPALSPLERYVTLQKANLLEGLSNLYNKILGTLGNSYERQKHVAADTFKWLSFSLYSLGTEELHTALAIIPGKPTDDLQLLADYPRCIQQITLALVDINLHGTISFIHLSLKEFLETDPTCHPFFSLRDQPSIHGGLAARCISYLIRDIPEKPLRRLERDLSLETGVVSCGAEARLEERLSPGDNRANLLKMFPFVKYASFCWATHLTRSLSTRRASVPASRTILDYDPQGIDRSRPSLDEEDSLLWGQASNQCPASGSPAENTGRRTRSAFSPERENMRQSIPTARDFQRVPSQEYPWIPLLSEFLVRRLAVTVWVEACWTFNLPPTISPQLIIALEQLPSNCSPTTIEGRELWWIYASMGQLSEALKELREKHRDTLVQNPTLIWQPHIVSATDPDFWPLWEIGLHEENEDGDEPIMVRAGFSPQREIPPATPGLGASINLPISM